jgi:Spy/CpxP family protein refolding chaperone
MARAAGVIAVAALALGVAAPRAARASVDGAAPPPPARDGARPSGGTPTGHGPWMPGPWMPGPWMQGPGMRGPGMHGPWNDRGATEWIVIRRPLGPEAGGWHRPRPWRWLARTLRFTAAQRKSARAIWRAEHGSLRRLHEQMRANEAQLRATNPDAPNYASVLAHVSQANGALFAQLVMRRGEMREKFFGLLTPGQKAMLARWKARRDAAAGCGGVGRGGRPPMAR